MTHNDITILFVEDDELTRQTITRRLRRSGFQVLEADSSASALEASRSVARVDLLLIEPALNQPQLELHQTLRQTRPGLPVVVCTAAVEEISGDLLQQEGIPADCCCSKPCAFAELCTCLERALAAARVPTDSRPA